MGANEELADAPPSHDFSWFHGMAPFLVA